MTELQNRFLMNGPMDWGLIKGAEWEWSFDLQHSKSLPLCNYCFVPVFIAGQMFIYFIQGSVILEDSNLLIPLQL